MCGSCRSGNRTPGRRSRSSRSPRRTAPRRSADGAGSPSSARRPRWSRRTPRRHRDRASAPRGRGPPLSRSGPAATPRVRPGPASAASAASQASRNNAISPASLTSRSASTVPEARTRSGPLAGALVSVECPSTVTTWLSKPRRPHPAGAARATRCGPQARSMTISASGACCAACVRYRPSVANTGVGSSATDQQRGVRSGETGQITDVDQVRYQHRVQVGGDQALDATGPGAVKSSRLMNATR